MISADQIKALAKKVAPEVVNIRRQIHANPELSFQEHETSQLVIKILDDLGVTSIRKIAGTGVIATIEGKNPEKATFFLRADLDALPILEANEVPYKSKKDGVMHACGHDVHTACLLGAGSILMGIRNEFEGTIKLVFQPGEEKLPGGASLIIKEGGIKDSKAIGILGQHVMPLIPVGKVGFREGMYMASADEIYLEVEGKGGHAAIPERLVDPVLIASHIIIALQQVVSRNNAPGKPSVLSFGRLVADGATNIIPDKVHIAGTFRTMDEEWRKIAHEKIRSICEHTAMAMGGRCHVDIQVGYPYLKNDPSLTQLARNGAEEYLGAENIEELPIWMGAEDFSFYSQELPACFYRLGTRNEAKGITSMVHTSTFDIDEEALEIGCGLMAWIGLKALNSF